MFYKIGAVLYVLWGVVHIGAAADGFRLARTVDAELVRARLMQNAWHLGTFAIAAIAVGVTLNWTNSETGYWVNLIAVSVADIGFVLFVWGPRHIPVFPGIIGPVLWLLAAAFSTLGILLP
ncbi:MAG: hypothetical protein GC190_00870 [Alphaproteobacteria bacterium]|nr:hypothetical protein [Alphaproteobacteria bacterium]